MIKSIVYFIAISLITLALAGCATSNGNKKNKPVSLYHLIIDENYSVASERLKTLYSAYPSSFAAEAKLLNEVEGAVVYLPKRAHTRKLEGFIKLNRNQVAGKFMAALYFHHTGLEARGTKFADKTAKKKLKTLRNSLVNSVARFQSVLEDDPTSYLAHRFNAINYSYIGSNETSNEEFRAALALSPANLKTWNSFLTHNEPRWGGSHEMMESLIVELSAFEQENPELSSLKGLVLADKADAYIRHKDFTQAEDHIFKALEFGSNRKYGRVVDKLMRHVKDSGDEVGTCRIVKKVNAIYPDHKRYRELKESCV